MVKNAPQSASLRAAVETAPGPPAARAAFKNAPHRQWRPGPRSGMPRTAGRVRNYPTASQPRHTRSEIQLLAPLPRHVHKNWPERVSRLGTGAAVWVDEGGVALMTTSDTTGPHSSDSGRVSVRYLRVGAGGHLTVDGGVHVVSDSDVVIAGTVFVGWNVTLEASNNVTLQVRPSLGARVACLSELSLAKRPW